MKKKTSSFCIGDVEESIVRDTTSSSGFKSRSEYINWLIRKDSEERNPGKALDSLDKEEELIDIEVRGLEKKRNEIRKKRKQVIAQIELQKELQNEKRKKRPFAIQKITELLINGNPYAAEQRAKAWGNMLNLSPSELLAEAIIKRKETVYGQV
jgi:Arc/MetJ-type ribon-helix-helix transcriptional regulator